MQDPSSARWRRASGGACGWQHRGGNDRCEIQPANNVGLTPFAVMIQRCPMRCQLSRGNLQCERWKGGEHDQRTEVDPATGVRNPPCLPQQARGLNHQTAQTPAAWQPRADGAEA